MSDKTQNLSSPPAAELFERTATPEQLKAHKKELLRWQKDYLLHVALIEVEGLSVSAARAVAYREGRKGLRDRLGVPHEAE